MPLLIFHFEPGDGRLLVSWARIDLLASSEVRSPFLIIKSGGGRGSGLISLSLDAGRHGHGREDAGSTDEPTVEPPFPRVAGRTK